jgi:hypothetical protein
MSSSWCTSVNTLTVVLRVYVSRNDDFIMVARLPIYRFIVNFIQVVTLPLNGKLIAIMASPEVLNGTEPSLDQLESDFLELLRTATNPTSSSAMSSDRLAKKLGIDGLPSREEAFQILEEELLAPAKDLSGPDLSRWQA